MGHPGQFVVVRDGVVTQYRVSTLALPVSLMCGPEAAARHAELVGYEREVWAYAEGGAVVNFDRKRLRWCGVLPAHPEWVTAIGTVLDRTWPGWRVRWAYQGVPELAHCVGVDAEADHRVRDDDTETPVSPPDEPDDLAACLVTVRRDDTVTAHPVEWPCQRSLLARGPQLVRALPPAVRKLPLPVPESALHIDEPTRCVTVWGYEAPVGMRQHWPGWRIAFNGGRFAGHNTVARATVTRPLDLGWAYLVLRRVFTGDPTPDWPGAPTPQYYGDFFDSAAYWQRHREQDVAIALAALDGVTS